MNLKLMFSCLFVILSYSNSWAQATTYDRIYEQTSQVLLTSNPKKALTNTDYLYKISTNNNQRIDACMLKATLLRQYNINNEAIHSLTKADSLATIDKNFAKLARINGFLSTIYREIGVPSIGKTFLKKALAISKKITDKDAMYRFQGNLCQELAYYAMSESNYTKANTYLFKGNKLFSSTSPKTPKSFHLAVNNEIIAKNFLAMNKIDTSLIYFLKAQKLLRASQSPGSPLGGFIYNGLGNVYTARGDYKNANINYIQAVKIAESSNFYNLKNEVYSSLLTYYKKTKNNKQYIRSNENYLKMITNEETNRKIIADNLISTLRDSQKIKDNSHQQILFIITGISVFIILTTLFIYYYKRKQDHEKAKNYIKKKSQNLESSIIVDHKEVEIKKEIPKEYMSQETEEHILKSIEEFELTQHYLNKDLSLNVMAAKLNINHRYLSYVINKHKNKDFATYINELRIGYIVNCLTVDSSFLKYKISYLADKCGFSCHSRFTITFKKITGVSPLTFITYLKEEYKETSDQT